MNDGSGWYNTDDRWHISCAAFCVIDGRIQLTRLVKGDGHLETKSAKRLVHLKLPILLVNVIFLLICEKLAMGRFWAIVTMVLMGRMNKQPTVTLSM